jgi:hypothetical protein
VLGVAVIPNAGEDKASVIGVPAVAAAGGDKGPPEDGLAVGEENTDVVPAIAAEGEGEVSVQGDPVAPAVDRKGEAPVAQAVAVERNGKAEKDEEGIKWLKHYSSAQSILIVGDGDFSFSLALAAAFGSGENLVATSLDSYGLMISSPLSLAACYYMTRCALCVDANNTSLDDVDILCLGMGNKCMAGVEYILEYHVLI